MRYVFGHIWAVAGVASSSQCLTQLHTELKKSFDIHLIWHILTLFPRENKKNRQFQNVSKVICISLFKGNCAPLWWGNGIQKSIRDGYSSVPAEAFYSQNVLLLTYSKVPFIFLVFFKTFCFLPVSFIFFQEALSSGEQLLQHAVMSCQEDGMPQRLVQPPSIRLSLLCPVILRP